MYGKVFDSIYDGTLYGHWEAIVTMQQLIVLCTPDGMVDMTPHAIAARTSIPLKIITKGLKLLSNPDPHSRTPGDDGRRIVLMDAHRPWGWVIVNHGKYQHMQDADTVRAQTRERVRKHRELKRLVTVGNGPLRHSDSDSDINPLSGKPDDLAFIEFWNVYPRKVAKQAAMKAWKRLALSDADVSKAMTALRIASQSDQWVKDDGKFIPHAATWLNGRRFEDEEVMPRRGREEVI